LDIADTGRYTCTFFPKVNTKRLVGQQQLAQFFTGHGQFPTFVHRLGKATTGDCICGEEGNPQHYTFDCPLTSALHLNRPTDANIPTWSELILNNKTAQNRLIKIIKKLEIIKPVAVDNTND